MTDMTELGNTILSATIPIADRMGVRVVDLCPGHVVGVVGVDGNTNHVGTMYAGVLFTVAEVLGGAIAMVTFDAEKYVPIVKEVQIKFRRPARSTVRATASLSEAEIAETLATAEEHGKADFDLYAELVDADGMTVATTHGVYQIRRHDHRSTA
ncbi:YiiD C-terminal domain-containing protein [Kutzneria sp. CA-103260]|uniref:YiiD C-terminal domain-containing protein n=1 Tax=Kutzneria sp. CA-103260 TaxID=2802641 RepID=UPI001BA91BAA|nr:YiiD C-terminal domain-containing protein [Kutzneria sp. CA-103260]QUQ64316.1 hypothetical protein JJ691_20360 [Kutzneria sp. CA-103260]